MAEPHGWSIWFRADLHSYPWVKHVCPEMPTILSEEMAHAEAARLRKWFGEGQCVSIVVLPEGESPCSVPAEGK